MRYKNAGTTFVLSQITRLTDRRTDRQTELSLDRVCIPYSAVIIKIDYDYPELQ